LPSGEHPELHEAQRPQVRGPAQRIAAGVDTVVDELRERLSRFLADPDLILGGEPDPADPDGLLRLVPAQEASLRSMFAEAFRQGDAGWVEDWLATYDDWGFRLADVKTPVAVWRGDADRLSSAADSEVLAAGVANGALHIVPGAGHALPFVEWDAILDSVLMSEPARGDEDEPGEPPT
jgi:pimeloyl-ACP methyl ester carboxylesterase